MQVAATVIQMVQVLTGGKGQCGQVAERIDLGDEVAPIIATGLPGAAIVQGQADGVTCNVQCDSVVIVAAVAAVL